MLFWSRVYFYLNLHLIRGQLSGSNTPNDEFRSQDIVETEASYEGTDQISLLKEELGRMEREEAVLDSHMSSIQELLRALGDDRHCKEMAYITHQDVRKIPCFSEDTLLAVKAPFGSTLEVPDPDEGMPAGRRRYEIQLTSISGAIDVFLIQDAPQINYLYANELDDTSTLLYPSSHQVKPLEVQVSDKKMGLDDAMNICHDRHDSCEVMFCDSKGTRNTIKGAIGMNVDISETGSLDLLGNPPLIGTQNCSQLSLEIDNSSQRSIYECNMETMPNLHKANPNLMNISLSCSQEDRLYETKLQKMPDMMISPFCSSKLLSVADHQDSNQPHTVAYPYAIRPCSDASAYGFSDMFAVASAASKVSDRKCP